MAAAREVKGCPADTRLVAGCATDARQLAPCTSVLCWVPQWVDVQLVGWPLLLCASDGFTSVGLVRPVLTWHVDILAENNPQGGTFGTFGSLMREYATAGCTGGFTPINSRFYMTYVQNSEMAKLQLGWERVAAGGGFTIEIGIGPPLAEGEVTTVALTGPFGDDRKCALFGAGVELRVTWGPPFFVPGSPVGGCFGSPWLCGGQPWARLLTETISGVSLSAGWGIVSGAINGVKSVWRGPKSYPFPVPRAIVVRPDGRRGLVYSQLEWAESGAVQWRAILGMLMLDGDTRKDVTTSQCATPFMLSFGDEAPLLGGAVLVESAA